MGPIISDESKKKCKSLRKPSLREDNTKDHMGAGSAMGGFEGIVAVLKVVPDLSRLDGSCNNI